MYNDYFLNIEGMEMRSTEQNKPKARKKGKKKAGRPKGSGLFKEPTKAIRVPESLMQEVINILEMFCIEKDLKEALEWVNGVRKKHKFKKNPYL